MSPAVASKRPVAYALLLILTGIVGVYSSFVLVLDRIELLRNPGESLGCDVNPFVSCGTVIESWQGSLFGFPNPLIGVGAFVAPVAVGFGLLAGARFARWFWALFLLGLALAWVFITWLFTQTVFSIGTLCPWCMLVWAVTIPLFWISLVYLSARGLAPASRGLRRLATAALPYTWVIVVVNYAVIVLVILAVFPRLPLVLFG
jgi:uncharacterized membrane protein